MGVRGLTRASAVLQTLLVTGLLAGSLSSCGLSSNSCEDFVNADSTKQSELAADWLDSNEDEVISSFSFKAMSDTEKQEYVVSTLNEYCAGHPDDSLSELDPGVTFGL